jgi:hypothetical protein
LWIGSRHTSGDDRRQREQNWSIRRAGLTSAGIDPAPRRAGPGWAQFLRSRAEAVIAADLFAVDLLNGAQV